MSALEKQPTPNVLEASEPAIPAGIFLGQVVSKTYNLLEREGDLFEAVAKIQSLERAGRYLGTIAAPGFVTIETIADEQGNF